MARWHPTLDRNGATGRIVIGTGCLVAATTLAGSVSSVLIIVGISLPLLLVQDVSRFALLARRRGAAALLSDAAWR